MTLGIKVIPTTLISIYSYLSTPKMILLIFVQSTNDLDRYVTITNKESQTYNEKYLRD